VEHTWRKVHIGIQPETTGHPLLREKKKKKGKDPFSTFESVRNARGMKTEDGYNLGNIDHSSCQRYRLHIR